MKRLYVAYGCNLNLDLMKKRCPTAKFLGTSWLENHVLLFRNLATVEPKEGSKVPIAIYELEPSDETALEEIGSTLIRKENVEIELDGEKIQALMYVVDEKAVSHYGMPEEEYFLTIVQGYKDMGFDKQILDDFAFETGQRMNEK